MVVRNRLIALLLRAGIFALYVVALVGYLPEFPSFWTAIATWSVQLGLAVTIMMGLEIIYTLIDLRHGLHGAAAGPHMRIALPLTVFSVLGDIFYFASVAPAGAAPSTGSAVFFHVMVIVGPLLDWLVLDEKGTVPYHTALFVQIYPILFYVFGYFRTLIWPEASIFGGAMYALPFLSFSDPNLVGYTFAFFACTLGGLLLAVFFNNLLTGRYSVARSRLE